MFKFLKILFLDLMEPFLLRLSEWRIKERKIHLDYIYFTEQIRPKLRSGDIILMNESGYISNMLIPGKYNHAGIYLHLGSTIHAYYPKVRHELLYNDVLKYKDQFVILRHKNMTVDLESICAHHAMTQVGFDYDMKFYEQKHIKPKWYCSELVKFVFEKAGLAVNIDKEYILPDDFLSSGDFEIIFKYGA